MYYLNRSDTYNFIPDTYVRYLLTSSTMKYLSVLLFLLLTFPLSVHASHFTNASITWTALGNNQFLFQVNMVRDCQAIPFPSTIDLQLNSPCGNLVLTLTDQIPGGLDVTELCSQNAGNSACSGGMLPGFELHRFIGTTALTPCDSWTASWSTCCRYPGVNAASSGSAAFYVEAVLNTLDYPNNSSVQYIGRPYPFETAGELQSLSTSVLDEDCDSLLFELVPALEQANQPVIYTSGYAGAQPFTNTVFDQKSGYLTFTDPAVGAFLYAVKVSEFDPNGNLMGYSMVDNCRRL